MRGTLLFNWKRPDGSIMNWWSANLDYKTQFVFNHFPRSTDTLRAVFTVAIDFNVREAQIFFDSTGERHIVKFDELTDGNDDLRDALQALVDVHERSALVLAAQWLMTHLKREDLAALITGAP